MYIFFIHSSEFRLFPCLAYAQFLSASPQRLNIGMDNSQITYKKRNLTHNLQQPAQETNQSCTVASSGHLPGKLDL